MVESPAQNQISKEIRSFFGNEVLPGLEEIGERIGQGQGLKDIQTVAGLPLEWFASLVVDFYPRLSQEFKNQYPQPRLEDQEFLAKLSNEIKELIETGLIQKEGEADQETEERTRHLKEIVAEYQFKKNQAVKIETREERERKIWQNAIKRHNELILRSLSPLLRDLAEETSLPEKAVSRIQEEVKLSLEDGELGLHKFQSPQEDEKALKQLVNLSAEKALKTLPAALKAEKVPLLAERLSSDFIEKKATVLRTSREFANQQGRRYYRLVRGFEERARFAAYVWARLHPELIENPEFRKAFEGLIERFDPASITDVQTLVQKAQDAVQEAVEKVPTFQSLPEEARVELTQVRDVEGLSQKLSSYRPLRVPKLPPVVTVRERKAIETIEDALEKGLYLEGKRGKPGRYRLPNFTDETLSDLTRVVLERLTEWATIEEFDQTRQKIEETKIPEEKGVLTSVLKDIVQKTLVASFQDYEEMSGLKMAFPPRPKEEVFSKIIKGFFPDERFALSPFIAETKRVQTKISKGLKQIESSPGLFFTALLPAPLKPVGLVMDAFSLIPGVKPLLFAGYLGADKERLGELKDYYQTKAIKEQQETNLLKDLYGENAEVVIQTSKKAGNYQRFASFLSQVVKTVEKPPSVFPSLKELITKAVGVVKKIFPAAMVKPPILTTPSPPRPAEVETDEKIGPVEVEEKKRPSFSGRSLTALGKVVNKVESFLKKDGAPSPSLSFLKEIPRLQVALPLIDFQGLLDKISGALLYFRKPGFFRLSERMPSLSYFRFSLPTFLENISAFGSRALGFAQNIFSFASGLTNFAGGLISRGLSFLKLAGRAIPGVNLPLLALDLVKGGLSFLKDFLGGLFGSKPSGSSVPLLARGGLIPIIISLLSNPETAIAVIAVVSIVFITFFGFGGENIGSRSIALPHQLNKQVTSSSLEESKALNLEALESTKTAKPTLYSSP